MATATKTLQELALTEKLKLCFSYTRKKAYAVPVESETVIVWPSVYRPNSVEDNAPQGADAFRFCGEPYRTLDMARNTENVRIQYYKLKKE